MLTDAELLLGMWRHISTYAVNPAIAQLDGLSYAGKLYEMAWCLRGSGLSRPERVNAIAVEASITPRELHREILPTLEHLGWVEVQRFDDGTIYAVSETVPPQSQLIALANQVLEVCAPSLLERAALALLRATTRQPLEKDAALTEAADAIGGDRGATENALGALVAVGLVRIASDDNGRSVVFNPNIWVGDEQTTQAALRTEDARVRSEIGALIEEVSGRPGMPEEHVTATEQRWVDFAVANGLVQRSVVQTTDGDERRFLFTPHLGRDPFAGAPRDPSGHARQLVGSMIYAATFANYRLERPGAFLRALIRDGEAGDASPIGTDYPMLETAGIVRVAPGSTPNRFRLQLLQADVAEEALNLLNERQGPDNTPMSQSGLRGQRSYVHIEKERARLAHEANVDDEHRRRLLSALRETTARRSFGAR